jgi:protein-disulfide isomerase
VNSTPTFFVGDKKITGVRPFLEFQSAIDEALSKVTP